MTTTHHDAVAVASISMMTFLTMKSFCLQNRHDIVRVENLRHVLGFTVVVIFNDESAVHLRIADPVVARQTFEQLDQYTPIN